MEVTRISLEHTGRFNRLILDYINQDEKLNEFYSLPHELKNYKQQIQNRAKIPVNRELLADALVMQYQTIGGASSLVLENIESLRKENTYTVTTGHQLNIFTGPLYFVYKILHTIRLAEELRKAHPDNNFVPIYWMNSEDHDIDEVGQFNLFGKKYIWDAEQSGSTGRMDSSSLAKFCEELKIVFGSNPETLGLVQIFEKAYTQSENLASATRNFSNELFGKYGLVIIDSDDRSLKASFTSYVTQDIVENSPFHSVKQANLKLESTGYHTQVKPREINSFYLIDGIRNRIVRTEKGFHVLKTEIRFTQEELVVEIKSYPERFSPNVVLRPLFQEFILPNLTYIGGAGELAYWLQYRDYFHSMNVSFPMLSLRNHFLLMDQATSQRMVELQLVGQDLFHSIDDLIKDFLLGISDADVALNKELNLVNDLYDSLKNKAINIDSSLASSLESEQVRVAKGIEQWGGRFSRALKQKNEVSVKRIQKLHAKLFPHGYLQERHENFLSFYSNSETGFLDQIHLATEPFSTDFGIVKLA